jgi:2'-5' RNA ligase
MKKEETKEVKKPTKEGSYIGLNISDSSIQALKTLQTKLGINEDFQFHITLVYSRKKIDMDLNKKVNRTIQAEEFHIFDNSDKGGDRALVIKFHCPYCEQRHTYAETALGATYDYPKYESHITLAYKWEGDLPDEDLLKHCKLNITSEYYEKLDLEWTDTNVKKPSPEEVKKEKVNGIKQKQKQTPSIMATVKKKSE